MAEIREFASAEQMENALKKQKMLFADVWRIVNEMKKQLKVIDKESQELLYRQRDWSSVSSLVNEICTDADVVRRKSEAIMIYINDFLLNGPYVGETAGKTPMEAMAE